MTYAAFLNQVKSLLKNGKKVLYREGWEEGMTANEWEDRANAMIAYIEQELAVSNSSRKAVKP